MMNSFLMHSINRRLYRSSHLNPIINHILPQHHQNHQHPLQQQQWLFTNTDTMKQNDPYAILGLSWGATTSEIKEAFKKKARELHPDVNTSDSIEDAIQKFQKVQSAYSKLMNVKGAPYRDDLIEEWSFSVWRNSDIIAENRTDVAGALRKRPMKPAIVSNESSSKWGMSLGHPAGGGNKPRRGEYLGDGGGSTTTKGPRSNTVGTGISKWNSKKTEFQSWDPSSSKVKAVVSNNNVNNMNQNKK